MAGGKAVQQLTILGSTGSIGANTLDVVRRHRQGYRVVALCAHRQVDQLFAQCIEFQPRYAVLGDAALAADLGRRLSAAGCATEVEHGPDALVRMARLPEVDTVMAAIVGAAGLPATLAAAEAGKKILLANKEALVMAGAFFLRTVRENGAVLLPIDSEHNAIFQSLPVDYAGDPVASGVRALLLTASGGPFRGMGAAELASVSPEQACAHPNWVMGRKISVDSATMMNKGLEVIEAHWLFNVPADRIQVIIHPQSVIHSLVQYVDGSVIAELGNPDMRTPIAHALAYPQRIAAGVEALDLCQVASLQFEQPDLACYPCLTLAYRALGEGGRAPTTLNAANEVAVQAFLERRIAFTEIPRVIGEVMDRMPAGDELNSLAEVLAADQEARLMAEDAVAHRFSR
ncbi:MAG TPA: 1-deoxy-D-xylulose-5-phosphate reductoisomerase [Accumulibacter sp.]|uniref:1-deoxy-D-xylulose-5-phosphate reductoisomerase n=1 Tax=Accumulibacter sp. TaxID=2053492 RepID=UPI0025ECA90B|nr:1-deoxy-D-xylulose-5-phosphate reductoisomerase [Accumulibacter sp.]MCM8600311.1 1-deoxy-D-xylulose-5-phosphate reductoisomerase [Accumulibacter sp.]MCM8664544.1 1-deoxy-D-xylulose-5-phosphate reductoisomerase [Accumulibacter sp.]HNC51438.1 1-deoxy-D-xylulose-5-phosphate reductoisomerase [Accumulibacter sp.]